MNQEQELEIMGIDVQIDALKEEISTYDYIGTKIAMGVATIEEYSDEIAYTQKLRAKINSLEEKKLQTVQLFTEE